MSILLRAHTSTAPAATLLPPTVLQRPTVLRRSLLRFTQEAPRRAASAARRILRPLLRDQPPVRMSCMGNTPSGWSARGDAAPSEPTSTSPSQSPAPLILGLTGGMAMGKSTSSEHLRALGFRVHDSDACVHNLYAPGGAAVPVVGRLFPECVSEAGGVSRAALGAAVAREGPAVLGRLEEAIGPLVLQDRQQAFAQAAANGEWVCVADIPLLFEWAAKGRAGSEVSCFTAVAVVSCSAEEQLRRIRGRNPDWPQAKVDAILSNQLPDEEKRRQAHYVIQTDAAPGEGRAAARAQVAAMLADLRRQHPHSWAAWLHSNGHPPHQPPAQGRAVKVVTLDLDDTLYPVLPPILGADAQLQRELECRLPRTHAALVAAAPPDDRAPVRTAMRTALRAASAEHALLKHDLSAVRRLVLRRWAEEHGDERAAADAVMDEFVAERSRVEGHLWADALPALRALKARGLRLGAVTNGNCDVANPALNPALAALFDFQVSAGEAGAMKPHMAPFLMACQRAGCGPGEVVHVGDCLEADVRGALDCGMRAVHLARPREGPPAAAAASKGPPPPAPPAAPQTPSGIVHSLEQLPALLEEWGIHSEGGQAGVSSGGSSL